MDGTPSRRNKAPAKISQLFNATYGKIVVCVEPPCCALLRHVGSGCRWLKLENGQIFHPTFVDLA